MFDMLEENLRQNSDHQLIDFHPQVNQVISQQSPKQIIINDSI